MKRDLLNAILCSIALSGLPAASLAAGPPKGPGARPGAEREWPFAPVKKVDPPADSSGWPVTPIDAFVHAQLQKENLTPAKPADKRTLIRRATFDLLGLPPTPEEVDAFVADTSPGAFSKVVQRLLASPQYGERWGRHWLDTVRYADTAGFENDQLYANAWRYRDYVIRSLSADKPFDRFIQEQVAGDELWPADPSAVVATGLYSSGPVVTDSAIVLPANNDKSSPPNGAPILAQLEYEWLTDAADTTGAAFLGLTFGCARCHDHKYDPITQQDYYALQAVFAASNRPFPEKGRINRIKALNGIVSDTPLPKSLENDPRCTIQTEDKTGFRLFHRPEPMVVHRLRRGELNKPAEALNPAVPTALASAEHAPSFQGVPPTARRAVLARWLTARDNPMTARVLVNRVWGWHFGQAIVRTPNDFGAQGEPPTHPELLDWLAADFMDHGWSLKRLHRLIMLSRTYQMRSIAEGPGLQTDPQNRLLWHFPRQRLDAEAIRDSVLACAGSLNLKVSGPPVVPPLSSQELAGLFDAKLKWPVTRDASEQTRRSVYVLVRRTFIYPLFAAFDPPDVMTSCPRRTTTVVPTQALTLLNSPLIREQAAVFAHRLITECGMNPEEIVAHAWKRAFGRPATSAEVERSATFLQTTAVRGNGKKHLASPLQERVAELCLALFNSNEFIYVD